MPHRHSVCGAIDPRTGARCWLTADHLTPGASQPARDHAGTVRWADAAAGDDFPTLRMPPIRETTVRRPPPPDVRELRGAELLRALADELDRDEDLGDEEL